MTSSEKPIRQRSTAIYLIDRLALRVGNEKGDDEADTVGCCSLRVEHITLKPPNILKFDFLGKDSMRYKNKVAVPLEVYNNIKSFQTRKKPNDLLFDSLNVSFFVKMQNHLNQSQLIHFLISHRLRV
jgi:DNA topoisomerase-1